MKTFKTFAELKKEYNEFDFSKIEFPVENPVGYYPCYWDADKETFRVWGKGPCGYEIAERQNNVIFVGSISQGNKPDIDTHEERIKVHITKEIF